MDRETATKIMKPVKLFGMSFLLASTVVFWRIWITGALNGGRVMVTTNDVGEQSAEFMIMYIGFACVAMLLPKLFYDIMKGRT